MCSPANPKTNEEILPKLSGKNPLANLTVFTNTDSNIRGKLITDRESLIEMFNCTSCHDNPKKTWDLKTLKESGAHDEILEKFAHASSDVMDCMTCHSLNDRDNLHMLQGKKITYNEAFLLCGQCHKNKFDDWKNGAHGKKFAFWDERGAYQNCTSCHNPHRPASAFDPKMPEVRTTLVRSSLEEKLLGHSHSIDQKTKNEIAQITKQASDIKKEETKMENVTTAKMDAKKLYDKHCKSCHLPNGVGDVSKKGKPAINKLAKVIDEELLNTILKGVKSDKGKMPAFDKKLSKDEAQELVKLVKTFDKSK
jgi:cytochrome c5